MFTTPQPTGNATPTDAVATLNAGEPSGRIAFVCQLDKLHNQICVMNADGSGQRVLVPWPTVQSYYPSFAPDGQSVIFASNRDGEFELYEVRLTGEISEIPTVNREVASPTISPDGEWILFTIVDLYGFSAIALTPRKGGTVTILYDRDGWDPTWSPDGSRILFAGRIEGRVQLFIMDRDGTHIQQVTNLDGVRGRNDWSSKDDLLSTYIGEASVYNRNIYTVGTHGERLTMITNGGDNLAPSFSPDGNWITFMSYRDHFKEKFGCEIYIMRVDGSDVRRLTSNEICDWQPRWGR
ncbi:MAG: PD40 domain-containing protein [Anaerolineaceae bacterium]|nr:PD40 domain-containing protein [Anaerolineaceae bacterium]